MNNLQDRIKEAKALGTGLILDREDVRRLQVQADYKPPENMSKQDFADKHNVYLATDHNGNCYAYLLEPTRDDEEACWSHHSTPDNYSFAVFRFDEIEPRIEDWEHSLVVPRQASPKPKKNTPLQRMLDKRGRYLVVVGYCESSLCPRCNSDGECALKSFCETKPDTWYASHPAIINQAYEILTKENQR